MTSIDSVTQAGLSAALNSNLPPIRSIVEDFIERLTVNHAVDEAQGDICDGLIDNWVVTATKALETNHAQMSADLASRITLAEVDVQHTEATLARAERQIADAERRLKEFDERMERRRGGA
jgi:hypothetical protein